MDKSQFIDHSSRPIIPFMVGVYLAVNAIRDAYLLVEGPDCTHMKTLFIQGNQDYLSSLTSVSGFHRIANTALHPSQLSGSREENIKTMLLEMANHDEVDCVMLTSMPLAFITGADYERICIDVAKSTGKPVTNIPGKSLSNDWLGGYEESLKSIAKKMDIGKGTAKDNNVAIVGYLYDRNEEDNNGNIRELKRLLKRLGLNLISVWLGGQRFDELKDINGAGTIISLPYGRRAAKILSRRLNVRLIETELPFGLTATERWIRRLGKAFGCEKKANNLIDSELKNIVPKLEWVIPFLFDNRRFGYVGDPYLFPGFIEIIELVSGSVDFAVIPNCKYHLEGYDFPGRVNNLLIEERTLTIIKFLNSFLGNNKIDCVVSSSSGLDFISGNDHAIVEFGFPSYNTHALYDRPYLGFNGFMAFIDTLSNRMRLSETLTAFRRP